MRLDHAGAATLSETYGEAFYFYEAARLKENFERFNSAFTAHYPNFKVGYSYKTNYTPAVCRQVDRLGGWAEVVSEMEVDWALRVGVDPAKVLYNGPLKSSRSIRTILEGGGVVNVDSERDIDLLMEDDLSDGRVVIRCNFDIGSDKRSRFGIDVDRPEFSRAVERIRRQPGLRLVGLHCHFQDRSLESFRCRIVRMIELSKMHFGASGPEILNIGGGFFGELPEALRVRYADDVPAYEDYGRVVGHAMAEAFGECESPPILFAEPGTALVADAFSFVAKVVGVKRIGTRRLVTVSGSLFNVSPYSRVRSLPVECLAPRGEQRMVEPVDVVGYTCIEKDILSERVEVGVEPGDYLVYRNVGSYSIVMKPPFILPNVPILKVGPDGEVVPVRRAETGHDLGRTFVWS